MSLKASILSRVMLWGLQVEMPKLESDIRLVLNKGKASQFRFIFDNADRLCKYYGAEKVVKELI